MSCGFSFLLVDPSFVPWGEHVLGTASGDTLQGQRSPAWGRGQGSAVAGTLGTAPTFRHALRCCWRPRPWAACSGRSRLPTSTDTTPSPLVPGAARWFSSEGSFCLTWI